MENTQTNKRGRPRQADQQEHRQRVLDAALATLVEEGYEKVTMLQVAQRAQASKETLYRWFNSRTGLFQAVIAANSEQLLGQLELALQPERSPAQVLHQFSRGLLSFLTSPASISLNRAAMQSPELAHTLLHYGRYRVGRAVSSYFASLHLPNWEIGDPDTAFERLFGLVVKDTQIRVLLGEAPPTPEQIAEQASAGVAMFIQLAEQAKAS